MENQLNQNFELQGILGSKIRSKRDLHEYMRDKLNIWLPEIQYCRLSFLQQIIQDKKKYLHIQQIQQHKPIKPGWNEFSIKNIWPLIKDDHILSDYMPYNEMEQGRFPNKEFFWGIAFNLRNDWANKYYTECVKMRESSHKFPIERKTIVVSEAWRIKLMEHDFCSKGKKNKQSIVIEQAVRPFKKRDLKKRIELELYSSQQGYLQGQNEELQNNNESLQHSQIYKEDAPINPFFDSQTKDNSQNMTHQKFNASAFSVSERVRIQSSDEVGVNNEQMNSKKNPNPFTFLTVKEFNQNPKQYPQRAMNIIKRRKTDAGNIVDEQHDSQIRWNEKDSAMSQIDEMEQESIKSVSTCQNYQEQK